MIVEANKIKEGNYFMLIPMHVVMEGIGPVLVFAIFSTVLIFVCAHFIAKVDRYIEQ